MGTDGIKFVTVLPGERLDNLAERVYGDANKYTLLLAANPDLDLWEPEPGTLVEVPDAG